jgi:hypothetical protein
MRVSVLRLVMKETRGMHQRFMRGHCHPLRTASTKTVIFGGACVVEIYLVLVVDGSVARFGKFAGAEE